MALALLLAGPACLRRLAAGAIGLLTGNVVDRQQLYEQAVVLALVRFKNEALYDR